MKLIFLATIMFDAGANEPAGGDTALIMKGIAEIGQKSNEQVAKVQKELTETVETVNKNVKVVSDEVANLQEEFTELKKNMGKVPMQGEQKQKSFNEIIGETIAEKIEEIRSHKKGDGTKVIRLAGFEDENIEYTKAVGDMSIAANFAASNGTLTQDVRNNIIAQPYERTWLADILPGGSSTGRTVFYPKENGGEGAAALWTDPATDKPQMDFDLTGQTAYFKWIAGHVIVDREMLDDISFMTSYIQQKMLISLKTAENSFILNGSSDTNPVDGLLDVATAYNGTLTAAVDKIIDAAWGQIVEDTNEFYSPTHVILRPRDAVKIGLNKATGSGEYDLPGGSVGYVNGQLTIGGLNTVRTTSLAADQFLALDARATMFLRRMQPELRMFEDATLAKRNKIMFRIEERVTLAIFNDNAIVTGDLGFVA